MTKTLIKHIPNDLPDDFKTLISGAKIYDSSCSPEAKVYFIDRDGGYFLKRAAGGTLATEARMNAYFARLGLSRPVLSYTTVGECDWLLTERVRGEDLTAPMYLENPKRLCDTLAVRLRELHETDFTDCPVTDRMSGYFETAERNRENGVFDPSLFDGTSFSVGSADEAWKISVEGREILRGRVLLHGDYCLPNVIYDGWSFSGFIDLGNGGVGDRHVDIFWGAWTLNYNLKTDRYRERFLDCYGRELVNTEALRAVAATELFG